VVVPASVARTRAIDRAQRVTDDLDLAGAGLRVRFASPLWESETTGAMIAGRCSDSFEGPPQEEDGVVLVCEGEPEQWQREFSSTIEQETFFVQRIRASLLAAGFEDERVRVAWLEWEEPDVNEVLRHLAALGSRRIALMPACIPFDSVETTIDLRAAAERAATETGSEVFVLPGWGDDPVVADALCSAVFAALSESV
jgi:protoheme ferro-lyase